MTAVDPELLDRVRLRLSDARLDPTAANVAEMLRADGGLVGDAAVLEVVEALRLESAGAGPLDGLLRRPGVTDVLVNGPEDVYLDEGHGLVRTPVRFGDDSAVRRLAQRLAAAAGRRLDESSPFADVRLADGTRFHAVLAPVASPGTCLSLRVPARTPMSLGDLVSARSMTAAGADLLRDIVRSRLALVISGGTGTGKTTLLAALLAEADPRERVVVVEDFAELRPRHPHVVTLESREANVEGAGEITLRELVRQSLRMRPDRLVVGEVRGAEVVDMLAALNTGHRGGCCTVHANAPSAVPARIEALAVAAGLPRHAVHAQLASALDVVVHLTRDGGGRRYLRELAVLVAGADGVVAAVPAVTFDPDGGPSTGPGAATLERLLTDGSP